MNGMKKVLGIFLLVYSAETTTRKNEKCKTRREKETKEWRPERDI
jgi:hypothetical protein